MKYKAAIFDLFGTIVSDIYGPPAIRVREGMAKALSISIGDFNLMWSKSYYQRNTGVFVDVEENLYDICRELGIELQSSGVKAAAKLRKDLAKQVMMESRNGAIETLRRLGKKGCKTGLISNCDPDAPSIWPDTPFEPLFDVAVFSCSSGFMKPGHEIYLETSTRLGVIPQECIYVSNGQNRELRAAFELRMLPVLITPRDDEELHIMNPQEDEIALAKEKGEVISSLGEVLSLVG